tara:strand:- start:34 stop:462 length:429 start_codon:yes stop_codon:yes gene_type:complete
MLLKKISIFLLLISLFALPSISYANDPNYKKFSSYFYNPVKWLKKYPLNEQTVDDLIMNLGSPDSFIENEDIKYLSYQWGTTIIKITFFARDNIIFDALYDPTGSSSEIDGGGVGASLTMKFFGKLGAKSGKKLLASEIKEM